MSDMLEIWLVIASWVTAVATLGTVIVIAYTFKKSLPDFLSERYTKPMDMFFLRKEFFEDEADILRIVRTRETEDDEYSGGKALMEAARKLTEEGVKLNSKIKYILAHYEVLLYGVKTGRFDEEFVKEIMSGRVIGHYKIFKYYIEDARKKYNLYDFMECFEEYAFKWQSEKKNSNA